MIKGKRKFRKKPIVIEAIQLTWENWGDICEFIKVGLLSDGRPEGCYIDRDGNAHHKPQCEPPLLGLHIPTLEGVMLARHYDWIIKGVKGEIYPCDPEIFYVTYEELK